MNVLSLVGLLAILQGPAQSATSVSVQVGSKQVHVQLPSGSQQGDGVLWNHRRFRQTGMGEVHLDDAAHGTRFDLLQAYKALGEREQIGWPIKISITAKTELVEQGEDGIYRMRRSSLDQQEQEKIYQACALAKMMVAVNTDGLLRTDFQIETDEDPLRRLISPADDKWVHDELDDTLIPRLNEYVFDADDGQYRGPFKNIFAIYPHGSGAALAPYKGNQSVTLLTVSPHSNEWGIATRICGEVASRLNEELSEKGLSFERPMELLQPVYAWMDHALLYAALHGRRPAQAGETKSSWNEVKNEWVASLPVLDAGGLWKQAGAQPPVKVLNMPRQSLLIPNREGAYLLLAPGIASFVEKNLRPELRPAKVIGQTRFEGLPYIVFSLPEAKDFPSAASLLALDLPKPLPAQVAETFNRDGWSVERAADVDHGAKLVLSRKGGTSQGYIFEPDEKPLFNHKSGYLTFWYRTSSKRPISISFYAQKGYALLGQIVLGMPYPKPANMPEGARSKAPSFRVVPGEWQQIVVPLSTTLKSNLMGPIDVHAVAIGNAPFAEFYEDEPFTGTVEIAVWHVAAEPVEVTKPEPLLLERLAAIPGPELSEADQQMLQDALAEKASEVRINAIAVLLRARSPQFVPALIGLSKSGVPSVADLAIRALAFQGTDEAWNAIRYCLQIGPFEHCQGSAARVLVKKADPQYASSASNLLSSNSWRTKIAAVRALGAMNSEQANVMMMPFLNSPEPLVRLAVVRELDTALDLACKKLLYVAVNDPYESIRTASYIRLLESQNRRYLPEASKGARDESPAVRRAVDEWLKSHRE